MDDAPWWIIILLIPFSKWLWNNIGKPVWTWYFERIKRRTGEHDSVGHSAKREAQLESGVNALLTSIKADRAVVWGFHNGESWLGNNASKKKMSLKFEVPKDTKTATLRAYWKDVVSNIPFSQVAWWINETTEGRMRYPDTSLVPHLITRNWYNQNDVKSVLCIPIFNKDNKLTLIISYEWIEEKVDIKNWDCPVGVAVLKDIENTPIEKSDLIFNYFLEQNQELNVYL